MYTNQYQENINNSNLYKDPYDSDDSSYELSIINRTKELDEQIDLLKDKYENDLEELEYIYFGYHSHYHQCINDLSRQLNESCYNSNPGEKAHTESQILINKKNLNDQLIITKEKKLNLEKVYEDNIYSLRQEKINLQILYEQSTYYHIKKIDGLTEAMKNMYH